MLWCRKYGLPLSDKWFQRFYYQNGEDSEMPVDDIGAGLLSVNEEDLKKYNGFSEKEFLEILSTIYYMFDEKGSLKTDGIHTNILNDFLAFIKPSVRIDKGNVILFYRAESLLAASSLQAATAGFKKHVTCPICHNWFTIERGNEKYCKQCRTFRYNGYKQKKYRIRNGQKKKA
jgi:hypothetical protein